MRERETSETETQKHKTLPASLTVLCFRELMMGEEGKPGKKIKVKGRVKRPDRPPENPVVDVSEDLQFEYFYTELQRKTLQPQMIKTRHSDQN